MAPEEPVRLVVYEDFAVRGLEVAADYLDPEIEWLPPKDAPHHEVYRGMFDSPPPARGIQGAGTVHHIAWASRPEDHASRRDVVIETGAQPTPIIDRQYFYSIYFREPSGVLFELATIGPGFAIDEDPAHLGEALRLPPQYEPLRERLERSLTPLSNPRAGQAQT